MSNEFIKAVAEAERSISDNEFQVLEVVNEGENVVVCINEDQYLEIARSTLNMEYSDISDEEDEYITAEEDLSASICSHVSVMNVARSPSKTGQKHVSFVTKLGSSKVTDVRGPIEQLPSLSKGKFGISVVPGLTFNSDVVQLTSLKTLDEASKILKSGIAPNADPDTVIDSVITVFTMLKGTFPLIDGSKAVEAGESAVPRPLEVSRKIISLIGNIIGEWKDFFNVGLSRRHLVHEKLRAKLQTGDFSPSSKDDLAIFIRHKPMELIGDMITLIILELLGADFSEALGMTLRLQEVLEDPFIYKANAHKRIYVYLEHSLLLFIKTLHSLDPKAIEMHSIPSDEGWSDEMLRNRFLIWFVVERHLLQIDECQAMASDLLSQNIQDVEWLVTVASALREKRLKSLFPKKIDPMEKKLVKLACSLEPENPFVILSLMDILSDRKNKESPEFDLTCRNLLHTCGKSVHVMLKVSKYFLGKERNQELGFECIKRAIKLNPTHAQANYMCGIHLCKVNGKGSIGFGAKESFYKISIISDPSNFVTVFEYFKTALGKIRSRRSLSLFSSDEGETSGAFLNGTAAACMGDTQRYTEMIDGILRTNYSKSWTTVQRAKLEFLCVLSHYIRGDPDEAMEMMLPIYKHNQIISMIQMMDQLCKTYDWDKSRLSFDRFHRWLQVEYDETESTDVRMYAEEEELEDDDYEDDEEHNHAPENEAIQDMLAYLLRVL